MSLAFSAGRPTLRSSGGASLRELAIDTSASCDARSSPSEEQADITREEYRTNTNRNVPDSRRRSRRIAIRRYFKPEPLSIAHAILRHRSLSSRSHELPLPPKSMSTPPDHASDDTESQGGSRSEHKADTPSIPTLSSADDRGIDAREM